MNWTQHDLTESLELLKQIHQRQNKKTNYLTSRGDLIFRSKVDCDLQVTDLTWASYKISKNETGNPFGQFLLELRMNNA